MELDFIIAASQHQNGEAEIKVKIVKATKKTFLRILGNVMLTLKKTNMMLAEIKNLMNEQWLPFTSCHDLYKRHS